MIITAMRMKVDYKDDAGAEMLRLFYCFLSCCYR